MEPLLVLADDTTGALEAGGVLAAAGISATVMLDRRDALRHRTCATQALAIDTGTRHATDADARAIVGGLCSAACQAGLHWIYKKTDSTLRGPIAAELDALAGCFADPLVYVPAHPALGRTVRAGLLFVNGEPLDRTAFASDIRTPVATASILTLLEAGCGWPVRRATTTSDLRLALDGAGPAVVVCDGTSERDLKTIAGLLSERRRPLPCAGAAGFVVAWAAVAGVRGGVPPRVPPASSWLVVCGSAHPVSMRQAACATAEGMPTIAAPRAAHGGDPQAVASELATQAVRRIAAERPEAVVIFGGDTAAALFTALGVRELRPFGEVLPGVPVSFASAALPLFVTKAGGYGGPDLAPAIRQRMAV